MICSELDYEQSPYFLRDSRTSETLARVKITPREKHVSLFSRGVIFVRSTIPEEKWGLPVVQQRARVSLREYSASLRSWQNCSWAYESFRGEARGKIPQSICTPLATRYQTRHRSFSAKTLLSQANTVRKNASFHRLVYSWAPGVQQPANSRRISGGRFSPSEE